MIRRHMFTFVLNLIVGLSVFLLVLDLAVAARGDYLKHLPVQDAGRIKPYDTFAREALQLLWGKESYNGKAATDVVFSWMLAQEEWEGTPFVQIRHSGLREALGLENERIYYSPAELSVNPRVGLIFQDLRNKREANEKLDPFFQAVQTLESQLSIFHAVRLGLAPGLMPSDKTPEENPTGRWANVSELKGVHKGNFNEIVRAFAVVAGAKVAFEKDNTAENKNKLAEARALMKEKVEAFIAGVQKEHGDYAHRKRVSREVHYNEFHPFMWAWIAYLIATILFGLVFFGGRENLARAAWVFLGIAFLLHTYGFGLRVYIIQRAPVTNMYETVVWVAWGAVLIASILQKIWKNNLIMVAAGMVATLCLILCDLSSHVLDESLTPLEPVLRDNFWLLTHVLTITLSYAAFFLAFFVADVTLFYFLKGEEKFQRQIMLGTNAMYRSIQVGVVLLAAGTILGGVWADYSWGRFWGWDPKETWAFIALMGYIAVLHGRLAGWLRNFGLAVTSVLSFSLVIMAWYGVNFVLGAGLHTYGFGAGGVEYVAGFVALHLLYVVYVITVRQSRKRMVRT